MNVGRNGATVSMNTVRVNAPLGTPPLACVTDNNTLPSGRSRLGTIDHVPSPAITVEPIMVSAAPLPSRSAESVTVCPGVPIPVTSGRFTFWAASELMKARLGSIVTLPAPTALTLPAGSVWVAERVIVPLASDWPAVSDQVPPGSTTAEPIDTIAVPPSAS